MMNIKRNQLWLNSYDCRFLVTMKERNTYAYKKIKILVQSYRANKTGKILMVIASWFLWWKNRYLKEITKKASQNSIKYHFYQSVNKSTVCLKEFVKMLG